jgi:MEMO1 family protein
MMNARRLVVLAALAIGLAGCRDSSAETKAGPKKIRQAAVAGLFYPKDKEGLEKNLDQLFAAAKPMALEHVRGLVCPHAGYPFSGPTAAVAYKQLDGRDIRTVIVLGPSHYADFEGACVPSFDAYETPLGTIPVAAGAAELGQAAPFSPSPQCKIVRPAWWRESPKEAPPFGEDTPDTWEHSLEVQLPFLQKALKEFSIVPVVMGRADAKAAAAQLEPRIDDKTLVVASSDLSHYQPDATARDLDAACIESILRMDTDWMEQEDACGKIPILTLMHLARQKGWKPRLLEYKNSGDATGDKSSVVGYTAIAFVDSTDRVPPPVAAPWQGITDSERQLLLKLARKTVAATATPLGPPSTALEPAEVPKKLAVPAACFVTLTEKGSLRGCIGHIYPRAPLYRAVLENAQNAAARDPRFQPVAEDELDRITIEISILTIPKRLTFNSSDELVKKLRPGVDGVILKVGMQQATYLPQVWEQIPSPEQFLGELSKKAGLAPSAWKAPQAVVLTYQVEAFKEN